MLGVVVTNLSFHVSFTMDDPFGVDANRGRATSPQQLPAHRT